MFSRMLFIILIACLPVRNAWCVIQTVVPFQNITLQSGDYIFASYVFGSFPVIYCFDNNVQFDPPVATMQWPLGGVMQTNYLSKFPLVINNNFSGLAADPAGLIIIQNFSATQLVVNCQYAF